MAVATGTALLGAAAVGAAGSAYSANKAAGAQEDAANKAISAQNWQANLSRTDSKPWMRAGRMGIQDLSQLMGNEVSFDEIKGRITLDRVKRTPQELDALARQLYNAQFQDPNFGSLRREYDANAFWNDDATQLGLEYGMQQGAKGINRLAAASGGVQSGATLKALTRFGQNEMSTKFDQGFNRDQVRKQTTFNMLSGLAGNGQAAVGQVASTGMNAANNVSNALIGAGNARAASAIGAGNAVNGLIGQGINMYQQNQLLNALKR